MNQFVLEYSKLNSHTTLVANMLKINLTLMREKILYVHISNWATLYIIIWFYDRTLTFPYGIRVCCHM